MNIVELMVVVLIVGILAMVAVPIYQSNVNRSKASEADAGLGSIRTALLVHYSENSQYPTKSSYTQVDSLGIVISATDLKGKYFTVSDYKYQSSGGVSYTIRATGSGSQSGINRQMDQAGNLTNF